MQVETGIGLGHMVEILDGIEPGDRLVVRDGETLRPGQAIAIAEEAAALGANG